MSFAAAPWLPQNKSTSKATQPQTVHHKHSRHPISTSNTSLGVPLPLPQCLLHRPPLQMLASSSTRRPSPPSRTHSWPPAPTTLCPPPTRRPLQIVSPRCPFPRMKAVRRWCQKQVWVWSALATANSVVVHDSNRGRLGLSATEPVLVTCLLGASVRSLCYHASCR